jgi:hypothetical protein
VSQTANHSGKNPRLFNDEIKPEDGNQGFIGNCYFISSMCAIAEFPHLIKRLFNQTEASPGQSISINYCVSGIWQ